MNEMIHRGKVITIQHIRRQDVRLMSSTTIFLFGDNMLRQGFGGQAAAMRGEPNSIGVPTKWKPTHEEDAYFSDSDFDSVKKAIDDPFNRATLLLLSGLDVAIPQAGLGTGLADLPHRAPVIHSYIQTKIANLTNAGASDAARHS